MGRAESWNVGSDIIDFGFQLHTNFIDYVFKNPRQVNEKDE